MRLHRQVFVKANVPVDEGVADLVSALSEINELETIESCQGGDADSRGFVLFRFGDWRQLGGFLFGVLLPAMPDELRQLVCVEMRGFAADNIIGRIAFDPHAIHGIVECIRSLRSAVGSSVPMACDAQGLAVSEVV